MIIVTGGAGFIGSNFIKMLNNQGEENIVVVDNLTNGKKMVNLADLRIRDYYDKTEFLHSIMTGDITAKSLTAIVHLGACSKTTEWDGRYMMQNNYEYSKELFHFAQQHKIPFIYASSASVYGAGTVFEEKLENESTLNIYAYSKWLFDQYVRRFLPTAKSQIVGLRYFNVYGPREGHKGAMASVAFHFNNQLKENGKIKLFEGCDGYENGEQRRDFVYVDDVCHVNNWFLKNPQISGIYNVGTGRSQTFNEVAQAVIQCHQKGDIAYVPFPEHLKGAYQSFTEANLSALRQAGYDQPFKSVQDGVQDYLSKINQ